jgi:hypothetical protein
MNATVTWNEWLSGRAKRREAAFAITGGPVFRKNGPDDDVLKQWDGKREIEYPTLETLRSYERTEFSQG